MRLRFHILMVVALSCSTWCDAETIQFDRDIRPILSDKCFFCHGPDHDNREADLRLDLEDEARAVIVAGDPDASELVSRIGSTDSDAIMPPPAAHKELTPSEIDLLTRWIKEGATWTQHWAFIAPAKATASVTGLSASELIDEIVSRQIAQQNILRSPPASREKLIRRITYDLTGMPPTIEEIDAFLDDASARAYENVVDRLLDSPRYGQRMALAWLDAARYGDTSVYHADGPRDMWAWRDAIVDAYNRNVPFDEFSIAQIAGDKIPNPTLQQQILSGFNRNNGTTDEGGAIAEEYRVEYAVDRVKTTATVWLGLTMECAQCHDHKYDPISQEDYYRFYAFFNVSSDAGMQSRKGNAAPMLSIPDPQKQAKLPGVQADLTKTQQRIASIEANCEPELAKWIATAIANPPKVDPTPDGCVAQISLIEGSGTTVADTQAPERTNQIHGDPEWVKSRHDWGLTFNGSNYIDLGNIADFERTDSFSYGGWYKPTKGSGQGALVARMDDANAYRGFDLFVGDGPVSVHVINTWPDNAIKVTTKKRLSPDQWHHVFAVYDGSSKAKGVKIYVDGEVWDWKIEQNGLTESIKTDKTLLIGSRHPGSRLRGTVDEVQVFHRALELADITTLSQAEPIHALLSIATEQRSDQQNQAIKKHFLVTENKEYAELRKQETALTERIAKLEKPLTSIMVMGDMGKPRETFVLNRGAYDSPTDRKVQPGTLAVLPPMDSSLPRDRLGLAKWLFRDDHPLTARVAVNRYWQMLFGEGLVATPEDFGSQGDFPSHPALLDWLAVDFREGGWNVKRLIKQVVMSETYRQTSRGTPESYRSDPRNRMLARGPRFRLQGEFIRDTALAVSGLLVDDYGGPGVKPYQPPGLWAEVGLGGNPKFVQDHGTQLYRRSLYTYWKRSAPPPSMQIFDAPTREKCTIRRARTNTPLQALVTLNDTQFVEAARHFSERMIHQGGKTNEERIAYGFRVACARRPRSDEVAVLNSVLSDSLTRYQDNPESAQSLLSLGESPRDETLDPAHHAAWTMVASAMLNLDETLTRE